MLYHLVVNWLLAKFERICCVFSGYGVPHRDRKIYETFSMDYGVESYIIVGVCIITFKV